MIIQRGDEQLTVAPEQWAQMQASGMFGDWRAVGNVTEPSWGMYAQEPIKRGPGRPPKIHTE